MWYTEIMNSTRPTSRSIEADRAKLPQRWREAIRAASPKPTSVVGLLYKEEGDTRVACGPLFKQMSDGSLANYRDSDPSLGEASFRADGSLTARWFRKSEAKRIAKSEKLPLEVT